jgi:hypothetical protein
MTAKELCPSPATLHDQQGCVLLSRGNLLISLQLPETCSPTVTNWSVSDFVMKDGQVVRNDFASH